MGHINIRYKELFIQGKVIRWSSNNKRFNWRLVLGVTYVDNRMAQEIARDLKVSNRLVNFFGMCPYILDSAAQSPDKSVKMTKLSVYVPILISVANIFIFIYGLNQTYSQDDATRKITDLNEKKFGFKMEFGSLTVVILEMNFFLNVLNYILTSIVSFSNRQQMTRITAKIFKMHNILYHNYNIKAWNSSSMACKVNSITTLILFLHSLQVLIYMVLTDNEGVNLKVGFAYSFLSISASLATFDYTLTMYLLNRIFYGLSQRQHGEHSDLQFIQMFFESLDLLEDLGQSYGSRELFNFGTEFTDILSQLFIIFYIIMYNPAVGPIIFFNLTKLLPLVIKTVILSYYGSLFEVSVSKCGNHIHPVLKELSFYHQIQRYKKLFLAQNENRELHNTFSMHFMHYENRVMTATARNFFPINWSLIYAISKSVALLLNAIVLILYSFQLIGSFSSYFIVLIQFKEKEEGN